MPTKLMAVLGVVALFIGGVLNLLLPSMRYSAWGLLGLGVILLAVAFITEFRQVRGALVSRRGKFGASRTIMTSVFIGVILLANAISVENYHRSDLTALSQFTLTSQTKEVLHNLKTPVSVLGFFTPDSRLRSYTNSLLTEYENHTKYLKTDFIDPEEHPDQARQYGVTRYQTVVFESQNRQRLVSAREISAQAEHAFTNAILEVTGKRQKKVYFLTGHGEADIYSGAPAGYSNAEEALLDNLFKVDRLNLITNPSVPKDCAALIIAGPQQALADKEVKAIQHYLKNRGQALILINPAPPQGIKQLLSPWGINIGEGTVIDPSSYAAPNKENPSVPRSRNYLGLRITYFPEATAIIPEEDKRKGIKMQPLVWTSKDSWLEKDFEPGKEPEFNKDIEAKESFALGVFIVAASTGEGQEESPQQAGPTRLAVIGDSDFASNRHFYNGNNSGLFLNSVNWLTAGEELISIERKALPFRRLVVGPEEERFIKYSSIGLLPLIILVIGGIIWWSRR